MVPTLPVLLVLLLRAVRASSEAACSAGEAASFRLSVTSLRNESRHRTVSVAVQRDTSLSLAARDEVTLDVANGRSVCGDRETVRLETVATVLEPRPRRPDYELFPGLGFYKLHTTARSWEDARSSCVHEQAHLIVLNSDAEAGVVKEFFSRKPQFQGAGAHDVFGGFHDKFKEGEFITVTGEALNNTGYTHQWAQNQPNGRSNEHYGAMDNAALFYDILQSEKRGYICEQEL